MIESIDVVRLNPEATLPAFIRAGDAGMDLCALEDCTIKPFERLLIPTGIALAIPDGFAGFVLPRSGNALKKGLGLANSPGLIDSNYRGEIKVLAVNLDPQNDIHIKKGDRIAQLVIQKVETFELREVSTLDETNRGAQGFGSSGN